MKALRVLDHPFYRLDDRFHGIEDKAVIDGHEVAFVLCSASVSPQYLHFGRLRRLFDDELIGSVGQILLRLQSGFRSIACSRNRLLIDGIYNVSDRINPFSRCFLTIF